jgi:hypothetical protein
VETAPQAPGREGGSWRQRLVALGISLTVALFIAELVVRARFGAPIPERLPIGEVEANLWRGWRMVPGQDHFTYQHAVHVNDLGLRGPDLPAKDPSLERRILALGDSMIYGQGVAAEATLPAHLEADLAERRREPFLWRVINGGHRAYATNQELALLEELGPLIDPDVVILFWYDNDFEEYDIAQTYAELVASGPRAFDVGRALDGRALLGWKLRQLLRRSALVMFLHDFVRDRNEIGHDAEFYEEGFAKLDAHLEHFKGLCAAHGWRPLVAVVPHASTILRDNPIAARARRAQAAARALGLEVVELLPALVELHEELGFLPILPYDGHYLGVANQRMAGILAAVLEPR